MSKSTKKSENFSVRPTQMMYYWVHFIAGETPTRIQGRSWFEIVEQLQILCIQKNRPIEWMVREYL